MGKRIVLAVAVLVAVGVLWGAQQQQPQQPAPAKPQQGIPDAPSATRPQNPFPASTRPYSPAEEPPPPNITQVPEGGATGGDSSGRDELYKFVVNANFVQVPVTVKDTSGHLVEGLSARDFRVMEDGNEQKLSYFTSDPFPLSAAVVIDLSMPDMEVKKVQDTLSALVGAFGQFDEVGIYTFGNTVQKVNDFTAANESLGRAMQKIKQFTGRTGGVPVVDGPFGSGPTINGQPLPGQPRVRTAQRESHVLNDAILEAAMDLARRDRTRRKILFVISDGRELGSSASYAQVSKVLLSYQISVYAVAVGTAALPVYGTAQKARIPGLGYGDILPKYASATGGQVFTEFNQDAIEQAYSRVTEEARNQYTLGYMTRVTPSSSYRTIEILVVGHGHDLKVYAKAGYYPLPPRGR